MTYIHYWASLLAQIVKHLSATCETWVLSLGWEDPLEKGMATTLAFLPGEFHGQRILVSYSLWSHKELDTITSCHVKSLLILVFYKTSYYQAYHLPMPIE